MLVDSWGRKITYLRISVTDRCNLRCVYCMPPEGIRRVAHNAILSYEEIAGVVRVAAEQGVRQVRLTGGEPLVRRGLPILVRMIAKIDGIEDISLTTNGLLLEKMAAELKEAGLQRINVSLDTLNPQKFARITRGGSFETAWRGIEMAEKVGLNPIKINVVAMRGINEDELRDLAALSLTRGWHVRFIELMPLNNQAPWGPGFPEPAQAFLSIPSIQEILAPLHMQMVQAGNENQKGDGPARSYRIPGAAGQVGFISPLSEHFCQTCNRIRLTADGHFRSCLLSDVEVPFIEALRAGESILPCLQKAVELKPAGHELAENRAPTRRNMHEIGG